jgi:hypothetical protein
MELNRLEKNSKNQLRVLCLHGYDMHSEIMKHHSTYFRSLLEDLVEFVYFDGIYAS